METCKLCGFLSRSNIEAKCPVCGESYDLPARQQQEEQQHGVVPGSQLAQAATDAWCGMAQQELQSGVQAPGEVRNPGRRARATHFNMDLQSLLGLIPAQQNRRKRAEDVLRAVGAGLTSAPADAQCDPGVVYIRPRADPTMAVLKVPFEAPAILLLYDCAASRGHLASPIHVKLHLTSR